MRTLMIIDRRWGTIARIAESEPGFFEHVGYMARRVRRSVADVMALLDSGYEYRSIEWTYKLEAPSEDQADEPHVVGR
jgi:hypothetical protein